MRSLCCCKKSVLVLLLRFSTVRWEFCVEFVVSSERLSVSKTNSQMLTKATFTPSMSAQANTSMESRCKCLDKGNSNLKNVTFTCSYSSFYDCFGALRLKCATIEHFDQRLTYGLESEFKKVPNIWNLIPSFIGIELGARFARFFDISPQLYQHNSGVNVA